MSARLSVAETGSPGMTTFLISIGIGLVAVLRLRSASPARADDLYCHRTRREQIYLSEASVKWPMLMSSGSADVM